MLLLLHLSLPHLPIFSGFCSKFSSSETSTLSRSFLQRENKNNLRHFHMLHLSRWAAPRVPIAAPGLQVGTWLIKHPAR